LQAQDNWAALWQAVKESVNAQGKKSVVQEK